MDTPSYFALGIGVSGPDFSPDVIDTLKQALQQAAIRQIKAIATLDKRRDHPLIAALAKEFGAEIFAFSATMLERQRAKLANPSERLYQRIGCHGVAEAAALNGAGSTSWLVIPKTICHKVTFAVARASSEKCEAVFG